MQTKLENLPKSRIRLTVTLEAETIAKYYDAAVKKVGQHLEIKGFRAGHAPAALVVQKAGPSTILHELLDLLVPETYQQAIKEQKDIIPVAQPQVEVKELAGAKEGISVPSKVVYTAEVDTMPDIVVGDYKKIKVRPQKVAENPEDTEKEIEKTVAELKKVYGPKGDPSGDEWLTKMNFKTESEARKAIEENIKQQKIFQAQAATYDLIIEELLKRAKVEVPETFVYHEIHRMERQIELQAKAYGLTFDDWLAREKKTHEEIHQAWWPQAEKAAKVGLVLGKIAEAEGIDPSKNDASRLVLEKLHDYAVK